MIPVILHYALTFLCMELQEHLNFTCLPMSLRSTSSKARFMLLTSSTTPAAVTTFYSSASSSSSSNVCIGGTKCLFSAQCRLSSVEQEAEFAATWLTSHAQPQCVCSKNCVNYEYRLPPAEQQMLLCGDDFITYSGECELRKAECRRQARLKISLPHECGGCDKCSPYAKCVIQNNGFVDCNCPECPPTATTTDKNSLSITSAAAAAQQQQYQGRATGHESVCGTDGITYHSECELNQTNCLQHRFVGIQSRTSCATSAAAAPPPPTAAISHADSKNRNNVLSNQQQQQKTTVSSVGVEDNDNEPEYDVESGSGDGGGGGTAGEEDDDDDVEFDPRKRQQQKQQPRSSAAVNSVPNNNDKSAEQCLPLEQSKCRRLGVPCTLMLSNATSVYEPRCVCTTNYFNNCTATTTKTPPPVCAEITEVGLGTADGSGQQQRRMLLFPNECAMREYACQTMQVLTVASNNKNCHENAAGRAVEACGGRAHSAARNTATGREYFCAQDANRGHPDVQCPPATYCDLPSGRCCPLTITSISHTTAQNAAARQQQVRAMPPTSPRTAVAVTTQPPLSTAAAGGCTAAPCNSHGTLRCEGGGGGRGGGGRSGGGGGGCVCKSGVIGIHCDSCMPGYWGMRRLSLQSDIGCQLCNCDEYGSLRFDCDQSSGQCTCRKEAIGLKCDRCGNGGCKNVAAEQTTTGTGAPTYEPQKQQQQQQTSTCADLVCKNGAECVFHTQQGVSRYATCVCKLSCDNTGSRRSYNNNNNKFSNNSSSSSNNAASPQLVCGTDGITYTSLCHLQLEACRFQRAISVVNYGYCRQTKTKTTSQTTSENVAKLYDSCFSNSQCQTHLAICDSYSQQCTCPDGYIPSADKLRCIPADTFGNNNNGKRQRSTTAAEVLSREDSVAAGAPTVIVVDNSEEERLAPSFDGYAYYELPALQAHNELNIELHLRPLTKSGIILYNNAHPRAVRAWSRADDNTDVVDSVTPAAAAMPTGNSDFVALTLRDGLVRFVYNLGDGPVILQSQTALSLGKRHTIVARRYHQGGMLQIDGKEVVKGRSPGNLKVLNLKDKLYIGWTPDAANYSASVYRQLGTLVGYVGCIYLLKIDNRPVHLPIPPLLSSSTMRTERINSCSNNACRHMPCLNGGMCATTAHTASLNSRKPTTSVAELRKSSTQQDDFACKCPASFTGERCERRFDPCWTNPCGPTSTCIASVNDNDNTYKCVCDDNLQCEAPFAGAQTATDGGGGGSALQKGAAAVAQPTTWSKLLSTNSFAAVTSAEPSSSSFNNFAAAVSLSSRIPYFNGNSYMKLPMLENATHGFSIEIWFRPEAPDGLILYNGQSHVPREGDFVELGIYNGFLTFSYNLGSGGVRIRSPYPVTLGQWHTATIEREAREGRLTIDEYPRVVGTAPGQHRELNLYEPLYVGGLPFEVVFGVDGALSSHTPSAGPPAAAAAGTKFFVGAIQRLIINGRHYDDFVSVWDDAIGLGVYEGPPCYGGGGGGGGGGKRKNSAEKNGPCRNGGECVPVLGEYHCKCFHGFTGETCSQRIIGEGLSSRDN